MWNGRSACSACCLCSTETVYGLSPTDVKAASWTERLSQFVARDVRSYRSCWLWCLNQCKWAVGTWPPIWLIVVFSGSRCDPLEGSGDFSFNCIVEKIKVYDPSAAKGFFTVHVWMTKQTFNDLERIKLLCNARTRGTWVSKNRKIM